MPLALVRIMICGSCRLARACLLDFDCRVVFADEPAEDVYFVDEGAGDGHGRCVVVCDGEVSVGAVEHEGCAEFPAVDEAFEFSVSGVVAAHEADLDESFADGCFEVDDSFAGVGCGGEGFFAEDGEICFQGAGDEAFVIVIGGGDDEGVDFFGGDE